jgi:glycerol uptake facilitator-like aquaporin
MTARPLAAEALGTLLLILAPIGSGIMAARLSPDVGVQLLAAALVTGMALIALITIFAPVSGAHFNPAVTLVLALKREMTPALALAYVVAQCAGAFAGILLTHAMFDLPLFQIASQNRGGANLVLAEAVATFGLILVILGGRASPNLPALVGGWIAGAYWFTASTSFANPVMSIARMFTDTPAGIAPANAPGFLLGQFVGAGLAALLGTWLFERQRR